MKKSIITREFYTSNLPANAQKITVKADSSIVYAFTNSNGKPCAMGFRGKSQKPAFNLYFATEERRTQYVTNWVNGVVESATQKQKLKAERNAPHSIKVGDIFRASWGYDQTNIDFYECTKVIGSAMIEVREIGAITIETEFMQGECAPSPGIFCGEPMKVKVQYGDSIKVSSCAHARLMTPEIVAGVKIYQSSHYTSYA